ncbi:MAG: DUF4870 family protein [Gammaproteobacteria bacterium]
MTSEQQTSSQSVAKVIYILLIISTLIGITGLIAVVMAYVNKDDSADWLQTHYRFQIRTFWIGVLYFAVGIFTFQIMIGLFILIFTFFWVVIRCAKGLKQLEKNQAMNNVESWLFA